MKKNFVIFFLSFINIFAIFSQDINSSTKKLDYIFNFGPSIIINTDSSSSSAPSPIVFPFSFGVDIRFTKVISLQPTLGLFFSYYLWTDEKAAPAEIENRTATVASFFVNIPVEFSFALKKNDSHSFQAGIGPSALLRFAFLANNVNSSDFGSSGSAQSDVENINNWFWQNANFLYLRANFSYLFKLSQKSKVGLEASFYLPIGSIITEKNINSAIVSTAVTFRF